MKKSDLIKAIKFSIVGFSNTLISYFVFFVLFKAFGILYLLSSIIAYFAGLLNSYFWNLRWTFKKRHSKIFIIKFIIINLISLGSKLAIIYLLVEYIGLKEILAEPVSMVCAIGINFTGNNFWTFK